MTRRGAATFPPSALEIARRVDLLILDVDGVMTDGRLYYADYADSISTGNPSGASCSRGNPSGVLVSRGNPSGCSDSKGDPSGTLVSRGNPSGTLELKAFYAQDGAAIKMLQAAGIPIAIISGRTSEATARRARELGIAHVHQGVEDKTTALRTLCEASGIAAERMAHAGDDIPDLPLFDRVGMRLSVADAHPEVAARADYVTAAAGGAGAVREICQLILIAKGLWESAIAAAGASST